MCGAARSAALSGDAHQKLTAIVAASLSTCVCVCVCVFAVCVSSVSFVSTVWLSSLRPLVSCWL